jgi:hypothetical protein
MTFPPPTELSERLVAANLGLAHKAAWAWHRKTQQPYDDLESIAYLGLVRGCRKYDPQRLNPSTGRPYAVSTIVCPFINGEILHWFRDHGYSVKFPHVWREKWGLVQRLMADRSVSTAEVAERAGMTPEDIREMLGAMTGTANLDDLRGADGTPGPEIELRRLGPLQILIRKAWANLHAADQGLIVRWWGDQRRHAYPSGPLQQFHRRLKALLSGKTLTRYRQTALALEVEMVEPEPKVRAPRRKRTREELDAAVQLVMC